MTEIPTSEVLNRAADLIEERGWTSGEGWEHEKGGPLCLEGGILAAIGGSFLAGDHYLCPAYQAVKSYLRDRTDKAPFMWNDYLSHERVLAAISRGETLVRDLDDVRAEADEWAKAQVIEVLRACAVIEASREREAAEVSA
jgi:hypothetical protein